MTNIFVFLIYLTYADSKLIAFYCLSLRFEDKLETLKKERKKERKKRVPRANKKNSGGFPNP